MVKLNKKNYEVANELDHYSQIKRKLLNDFEKINFIWLKDDYIKWLNYNSDMVIRVIREKPASRPRDIISKRFEKLRIRFANYLASSIAANDFLFNYGKEKFPEDLQKKFDNIAKRLKKTPHLIFLKKLRNRQLHGGSIFGILGYYDYENFRDQTERFDRTEGFYPVLTKSAMNDLRDVNNSDDYVSLLDGIEEDVKANRDWLLPILKRNKETVENAFKDADNEFRKIYATEIAKWNELENELHNVEKLLNEKGYREL